MNIIIFSTNEFDIYQDKNKTTLFTIVTKKYNHHYNNHYNHHSLFRSIVNSKIVNNSTIYYDEEAEGKSQLKIKALSIQTFEQFKEKQRKINGSNKLSHNIIQHIIYSLSKQIFHLLHNESKCFYEFDPSNILVIDDCKFIYLSYEHLKDVKDNKIHIYNPISKNTGFLSPELLLEKSIPILINYKTIFYSLGLLILDNLHLCTFKTPTMWAVMSERGDTDCALQMCNGVTNITTIEQNTTKLYYFLKRCLNQNPNKRFLLYV